MYKLETEALKAVTILLIGLTAFLNGNRKWVVK